MEKKIDRYYDEESTTIVWPSAGGGADLTELDMSFIGTANYMGVAFFWSHEYRFYLRDARPVERVRVHDAFINAGLPLAGTSMEHLLIIEKIIGRD